MYLVFDVGGTNMRVAVSDGNSIEGTKIVPTPADFTQGLQALQQIAGELSLGDKIQAVAGGIAGPLDKQKSMLATSPHIPGWIGKPLKLELEKIYDCQVELENDAKIEGLGEAVKGAGVGKNIVAYISLGTGIGGVRVVDGKIDKNAWGFEPGHQVIVPDGNPCDCGGKGHLEAYVGGSYIEKTYQQKAENIQDDRIWDQIAKYLSIGLYNTIVFWSPDIIILGGSLIKSLPLERVRNYLKEQLKIFPIGPELTLSTLGDEAGLYGALELLR